MTNARILNVSDRPRVRGGGDPNRRTKTHEYVFEMDRLGWDFWVDIYPTSSCPKFLNYVQDGTKMFLVGIDFKQDNTAPQCCNLTLDWADQYGQNRKQDEQENPLLRGAKISHGSYKTRKVWEQDLNLKPFTTTAGEIIPYDEEIEYGVIHIEKNVQAVDSRISKQRNFINSDTVNIQGVLYEPKTLRFADYQLSDVQNWKDITYYKMNFNLYYTPETWVVKLRNAGYQMIWPVTVRKRHSPTYTEEIKVLRPVAIKTGNPPNFPSHPLPLINDPARTQIADWPRVHGALYPEFYTTDPITGLLTINPNQSIDPARLAQIWRESVIEFSTKNEVRFQNLIPVI